MTQRDDELVELTTRPNELDAELVRDVLRGGGIESVARVANGYALGVFGASSFNPICVLVRRDELDAANRLLTTRREESVDIDWAEVDVGEPADEVARGIAGKDDLDLRPRGPTLKTPVHAAPVIVGVLVLLVIGATLGAAAMLGTLAGIVVVFALIVLLRGKPRE